MVSNNIYTHIFSLGLSAFILQLFIQRHVYKASFLVFVISVHSVVKPANRVKHVK